LNDAAFASILHKCQNLDDLLDVKGDPWQTAGMKSFRRFHEPVTGEELFGSPLPDEDLRAVEVYPTEGANTLEMLRWGKQLKEGGPPVDRELIMRLQATEDLPESAAQLWTLNEYVDWYRTSFALTLLNEKDSNSNEKHPVS